MLDIIGKFKEEKNKDINRIQNIIRKEENEKKSLIDKIRTYEKAMLDKAIEGTIDNKEKVKIKKSIDEIKDKISALELDLKINKEAVKKVENRRLELSLGEIQKNIKKFKNECNLFKTVKDICKKRDELEELFINLRNQCDEVESIQRVLLENENIISDEISNEYIDFIMENSDRSYDFFKEVISEKEDITILKQLNTYVANI
ncbi:hypothetical protein [Clostridium sp.]|uniref:hypothetical protein n=1 Tax=Clostridium sp. TaxID=1506 RepID=UPI002638DD72